MSAGAPAGAQVDAFGPHELALPQGARDLLPAAARRRSRLTGALLATLDRWGYDPVVTPAIEYFAVFGRWLAERDRQRCVRFIEAGTGELVTLRSDITPQIARLSRLRLGDRLAAGEALRLAYAADVVRLGEDTRGQVEHPQVGAELLGDDGPEADDWTYEQRLFQAARFVTEMEYQHLAFEDLGSFASLLDLFVRFGPREIHIAKHVHPQFLRQYMLHIYPKRCIEVGVFRILFLQPNHRRIALRINNIGLIIQVVPVFIGIANRIVQRKNPFFCEGLFDIKLIPEVKLRPVAVRPVCALIDRARCTKTAGGALTALITAVYIHARPNA